MLKANMLQKKRLVFDNIKKHDGSYTKLKRERTVYVLSQCYEMSNVA